MKKYIKTKTIVVALLTIALASCSKKLDLTPKYGLNDATVYDDPANYKHVLAKIYSGFNLSGIKGPAGSPDLGGIDEGFSSYVRVLWNLQELPTDEAVCGWGDPGIPDLNKMTWSSDNGFVKAMYYRIYFQVALCNEFIRESSDDNLSAHGFSDSDVSNIKQYRNEARFLRALSYYHQLDLFGTGPFVDEDDKPGSYFPPQISRADLFKYVESELLAVESIMTDAKNEYGRANKASVQTLLAKLYLNAEVYTGTQRYPDCAAYCNKVFSAGYELDTNYKHLFLADNNLSKEIIFPITSDGLYTQSYGCTTFLVHAAVGGSMPPAAYGINGGWAGLRTTKGLVNCFHNDSADSRWLFYTAGQSLEINDITKFTDGYAISKFRNMTRNGVKGSDNSGNFVDTDYPMFRLADVNLMYAEAKFRLGDAATALDYVNKCRARANATLLAAADLNLDKILEERGRELHWECTRRTDLIRYGYFTGAGYIWPYKGGDPNGVAVGSYLNLYPLPSADLAANTNLQQNPGY